MDFFYSFMKLGFPVSTFNAHTYVFAISQKLLHENTQKNAENHTIYLTTGEKSKPSGQKIVLCFMSTKIVAHRRQIFFGKRGNY